MFDNKDRKAIQNLPKLLKFTNQLIELTEGLLAKPVPYSEEDDLTFMGLLFVSRLLHLLESTKLLVEHNLGVAAGLVARAMMEGMCLFLWCARDPNCRPLQWRAYACVNDFRLIRQKEARGEIVPNAKKAEISQGLQKYGIHLLTNKARDAQQKGQRLPQDPYMKRWPSINVEQVFQEVQAALLYQHIYRDMSELTHWSVAAFGAQIRRGHQTVEYSEAFSVALSAMALAVGFQSLLESLQLLDKHLGLGGEQNIEDLKRHYVKSLQ